MFQPPESTIIEAGALQVPLARRIATYIQSACEGIATLRECRFVANTGVEIVSFDLVVELPQRPIYPIQPVETVSVCLSANCDLGPAVLVARSDFPDTPHQTLMPSGYPSGLCIDDRPWSDVRAGYGAAELLSRIQAWFAKAGQGELHGNDQPFDPFFAYEGGHQIIMSCSGEDALSQGNPLVLIAPDGQARYLFALSETVHANPAALRAHVLTIDVAPQSMRRIRFAPRTLGELTVLLREREVDVDLALRNSILEWHAHNKNIDTHVWLTCLILRLPQIHPLTGEIGPTGRMAFLCDASPGDIGTRLGLLNENDSGEAPSLRYVLTFKPTVEDPSALDTPIYYAPIHPHFDGERAAAMAGRASADNRRIVMAGAGSLGSTVAESLVREGLFSWSLVDDDVFLPHNIARHSLTTADLARSKADMLLRRLRAIRGDAVGAALVEDILAPDAGRAALDEMLTNTDLIFDASASVPVSRRLADHSSPARRVCAFFTPSGRSAVLMIEAADRSCNLRHLEAAYLAALADDTCLTDHLKAAGQLRYTGACRALTNRIPASAIAVLSGSIAHAISSNIADASAVLKIWSMDDEGSTRCIDITTDVDRFEVGGWTVFLPRSLHLRLKQERAACLPNEHGGSLMGLIDDTAKLITIVQALDAPPDSIATPSTFVRGTRGLRHAIETMRTRCAHQINYIGEWHSHPRGVSASPSETDLKQIADLARILNLEGMPAVSLIVSDRQTRVLIGESQ
ncbi:ThiF family adenylyltransferase (plasmid) [Agrobacterium sp. rho-8.1]|nr:ThiF family adenylyltransferase [Agrobacterium sp. rho-8.1]